MLLMVLALEQTGSEAKQLKAGINDLIGVVALPAIWSGSAPSEIVRTLLDALLGMLRLDFVYLRLKDSLGEPLFEVVRGELLKCWSGSHAISQVTGPRSS